MTEAVMEVKGLMWMLVVKIERTKADQKAEFLKRLEPV